MSSGVCSHCGCSDIDKDPARGDAVCTGCGSVLEDQIIVSEVQFQENAAGGASVIGQYVSAEGIKSHHTMGSGFHHGLGKESRAITLQNGKRRIQMLGDQLRLNQHCIDTAYNFFKMAVSRRLTRGRKTSHVVAACLYLVCRTEGTPHMLLDFSDILQVNVYLLGRAYLQLSRELCINIPAIDPCLYIHRFAQKLEFGEKTHEVAMTALRLVSRMKHDWMSQGRRPSGLCGAALLVAARIHDFSRTIREIIKVVKIGEATVRKRLAELDQTPSSQLTIDEFQKIDLEEEMDPPSFLEGRKKAKLAQLEEQGELPSLTSEISALQKQIDQALEEALQRKFKRKADDPDGASVCSTAPTSDEELEDDLSKCSKIFGEEVIKDAVSCSLNDATMNHIDGLNGEMDDDTDVEAEETGQSDDFDVDMLEQEELNQIIQPSGDEVPMGPRPTAASLGLKESIEECMKVSDEPEQVWESGELDLTGINDEELENYILSDNEVRMKTRIWMDDNAEYLKELREKEKREAELAKEQGNDPKKKKRVRRKQHRGEANSAGEAIEKMLQEKKISSKINYDVLRNLNQDIKKVEPSSTPSFLASGPVPIKSINAENRFKRPSASLSHDVSTLKTQSSQLPKKSKLEPTKSEPEVVIESGPVEYIPDEEEEDEYYEDEDEEQLSAAQLMGHEAAGDDDYGDYEDEY